MTAVDITPYSAICAFTAAVALFVGLVSWRRREVPGATSLALLMFAVAEWSLGAAIEFSVFSIPAKIFWSKIEYVGGVFAPVFLLLFGLEFNQLNRWITPRNIVLLSLVPSVTLGLAITNEWHGLIWTSFTPSPAGNNLIVYGHGPWFWVGMVGYSYLLMTGATFLIVWAAFRFPRLYRSQIAAVLAGIFFPWVGSLVYITGFSPVQGLELTTISLALSGILFALGIFRFGLFELVSVARERLIEIMRDGVVVLDGKNRIVDLNPAAEELLGVLRRGSLGFALEQVWGAWPELAAGFDRTRETQTGISLGGAPPRYLEISISPLYSRRSYFTGWLLMLRDYTRRKQLEDNLRRANEELRTQISEVQALQAALREQAIRDSLTELFNRRYLDEAFPQALAQARRSGAPVSILLLDIDGFKSFNDTYGHKAGDEALKALGSILHTQTRRGDIACRYGGDEFVVVMPGMPPAKALQRAEQLRAAFENTRILLGSFLLRTTLSAGVATFPDHGSEEDSLLKAADSALYAAKSAGRNQVVLYQPDENSGDIAG